MIDKFGKWTRFSKAVSYLFTALLAGLLGLALIVSLATSAAAAPQTPAVEFGPDHTGTAYEGQTVQYQHTVTNTGTSTDTFMIDVRSSQGWPVALLDSDYPTGTAALPLQVGPQMTKSFQLSLTIPAGMVGLTEMTHLTATSHLSPTVQDTAVDTTAVRVRLFFPLITYHFPPLPGEPTLNFINNADGDAFYTVTWSEADGADTYSLEEAESPDFLSPTVVYSGPGTSWTVPDPGKAAGTYYYRVRGHNEWGYGAYSNIQGVGVLLPDTPVLNSIANADGNGSYTVAWNAAARATSYILQQDTHSNFENPATVFSGPQISWSVTGQPPGTYYYRVMATGPSGESGWSNTQSASVFRFRADDSQVTVGECTTLRWDFTNIRAIYVSFGYGWDKVGVPGQGSRQVCPSRTTTYEALVVKQDWGQEVHRATVQATGDGCADPVIARFSPTTYEVYPGEAFSIFWDVECAKTVHFIQGDGDPIPVGGHDSRIDVQITSDTLFILRVQKSDGNYVYASFTVEVR